MRREGEGWSFYRGDTPVARGGDRPPLSPAGWATGPPAARGLGPEAGRPWAGRQAPVAPPTGDRAFFFLQGLRCKFEEKKLHFGPVALWEGDRGIFLKYFKTDIYF